MDFPNGPIPYSGWNAVNEQVRKQLKQKQDEETARNNYTAANRATVQSEIDQAKAFRSAMPGYENRFYDQINGQAKSAIAQQQANIGRQYKQRGLLYSGLRQGAQARAAADVSSQAAQQKSQIAPQFESIASDLESQASKNAQQNFANDLAISQQAYDLALASARDRASNLSSFFGAGGAVAGAYLAKGSK